MPKIKPENKNDILNSAILRKMFDNCSDPMVISDPEGRVIEANKSFIELSGYKKSRLIGAKLVSSKFLTKESLKTARRTLKNIARGKKHTPHLLEFKTKDGEIAKVDSLLVMPIKKEKKLAGFAGIFKNVSQEQEYKEKARESTMKFDRLVQNINDIIFEIDRLGKITYISPQVKKFGFDPKKMIGANIAGIVHKDDYDQVWKAIKKFFKEKEPFPVEFRIKGGDKKIYWLEAEGRVRTNEKGKIIGMTGIARDITDKKQAVRKLRKSQERYRHLAEHIRDVVYFADTRGVMEYISPRVSDFGFKPEQIVSHSILKYIHPDDKKRIAKEFRHSLKTGEEFLSEFRIINPKGEIYWLEDNSRVEYDSEGNPTGTLGTLRDISERKETEHELGERIKELNAIYEINNLLLSGKPIHQILRSVVEIAKQAYQYPDKAQVRLIYQGKPFTSDKFRKTKNRQKAEITAGGRNFGSIEVFYPAGKKFLKEEQQLIEAIARQISSFIERRQARTRFESVARASTDFIYEWHISSDRLDWYGDFESSLGYKKGEVPRTIKGWFNLIHPEDRPKVESALKKQRNSKKEFYQEYRVKTKSGNWRYWQDHGVPVLDPAGRPAKLVGACTDITERKVYQEKLKESEKKFRAIFEESNDAIMIADVKTRKLVDVNRQAAELIGYSKEELLKMKADDLHPKDVLKETLAGFKKQAQGKIKLVETEIMTKAGQRIPVEVNSGPVKFDGNTYIQGFFRDISERKQAEKKLKQSEEKYRTVFENTGAATVIIEKDKTLSLVNREFEKLSGYSKEEIEGNIKWTEFVSKKDLEKMKRYHQERRKKGSRAPKNYEFDFIDKGGKTHRIKIYIDMMSGTDKSIASLIDITKEKEAQRKLRQSEKKFSSAFQAAPFPIMIHAEDGEIIQLNDAWEKISGYTLKEIPTIEAWTKKAYGSDGKNIAKTIKSLYKSEAGATAEGELVVKTKSGRKRVWDFSSAPIGSLPDGRKMIMSIADDVTERKKIEEKVKRQEKRYRAVVENASEGILVAQAGRIVFANSALEKMSGYSNDELLAAKSFAEFIHPQDAQMVVDNYTRRIKGEEVPDSYDFRVIDKDGRTVWVRISPVALEWEGEPATLNFLEDITERKENERRLIMLSRALEQERDGVVITDLDRNILYTNAAWKKTFSKSFKKGKKIDSYFTKKHLNEYKKIVKLLDSQASVIRGMECPAIEEDLVPCLLTLTKLKDSDGKPFGVLHSFQDITEQKEYEESLRQSNEKLQEALDELKESEQKFREQYEIARRLNKHMVGRELRMKELKEKISELEQKLNKQK